MTKLSNYYNLQCHQWWQICQINKLLFSMNFLCLTHSISCLTMTWWRQEPGHHQEGYWPNLLYFVPLRSGKRVITREHHVILKYWNIPFGWFYTTNVIAGRTGAHPTNNISIELEIWPKFAVLWFEMSWTDHDEILHISWHLHCCDMCQISLWSFEHISN